MKCVRDNLFTSTIWVWTIHNLSVFPHQWQKWLIAFSYTCAIAPGWGMGRKCHTWTLVNIKRIGREGHSPKYCYIKQMLCLGKPTPQSINLPMLEYTRFLQDKQLQGVTSKGYTWEMNIWCTFQTASRKTCCIFLCIRNALHIHTVTSSKSSAN